jgi:hypothetical protein
MNNILSNAVGHLNALTAFALILAGAVSFPNHLVGAIVGFIVALIACGMIALFIQMHTELIRIREALERMAALPRPIP